MICGLVPAVSCMAETWTMRALQASSLQPHAITEASGLQLVTVAYDMWAGPRCILHGRNVDHEGLTGQQLATTRYHRGIRASVGDCCIRYVGWSPLYPAWPKRGP